MTPLAALAQAHGRRRMPPFGYSTEKIGFLIALNPDGSVAGLPHDLRQPQGRTLAGRPFVVPQALKRTSGIAPNFLWDKSAYVLGVTAATEAKRVKRLPDEHKAFVTRHLEGLADIPDEGLQALVAFLRAWSPDDFTRLGWPEAMKDQNIVFALEHERLNDVCVHDREAARAVWARLQADAQAEVAVCPISGTRERVARLHPAIKGVWGGQTSGVSLVSYNKEAFESYGHAQGDNAQISEQAAFAYTGMLNAFLAPDSRNRVQLGDASTVFWADAADPADAEQAEGVFFAMIDPVNLPHEETKVGEILERMREGRPLAEVAPALSEGVRFFVLGLAPNAARVVVRFWLEDDFGHLAAHFQRYHQETALEPPPRPAHPPLWRVLQETAVQGKRDNIPNTLAGAFLRALLTGGAYPHPLLTTLLLRIRADGTINAVRVGLLKALVIRNLGCTEAPVALDPDNTNKGYLLGRLFAVYEVIQGDALGWSLNATIKDKFYASASAQPRKVFSLLDRGSVAHLSKIGKRSPGRRVNLEKAIAAILNPMSPNNDPFPASLSAEQQALFALGYYHQRAVLRPPKETAAADPSDDSAPAAADEKEPTP
ncbi:type I-C CRISPR-associated protein Cas8c/Csd1 [Pararhodospirillum oryzae]|uniref:Type I-C CRISPR-associated protein Cas8c/Csd1 n=1 Tax=Pararhodospirillum oryzae TaxID=478448 RepID=A0A512H8U0_9PROT|nr:type I-C CRISPR-associated protein Cas8c/Csd1 [Pararhodospirillum oryzae]GEO81852.1 type I-C CRISPR-associated protein Cas8c/Csd1 [Pararhodospirillum oryzae]